MKKLLFLFLLFSFPILGRASCIEVPGCDFHGMLSRPCENLGMWKQKPCLSSLLFWAQCAGWENRQVEEIVNNLPWEITEDPDLKGFFKGILGGVSSNKVIIETINLSEDECNHIYEQLKSSSCSSSVQTLLQDPADDGWFNPNCLNLLFEQRENLSDRLAQTDGFDNSRKIHYCTQNFKKGCPQTEVDRYAQRKIQIFEYLASIGKIIIIYNTVLSNGHVIEGHVEDVEGVMLPEVVVYPLSSEERARRERREALAERDRQRVMEQFQYQGTTFPPGRPARPGQGGGESSAGGASGITREQCLEWENTVSSNGGVCEDVAALLQQPNNPAWLKPSCIGELTDILKNNAQYDEYAKKSGGELVLLGRMFFAQPWFGNFQKCPMKPVALDDLSAKMDVYLSEVNAKMLPHRARCNQLAVTIGKTSCPASAENLLKNASSNMGEWEIPQCIDEVSNLLRASVDINEFWNQTAGAEVVLGKMQKALLLPAEYNACSHAFDFRNDISSLLNATGSLAAALSEKGVNVEEILWDGKITSVGEGSGDEAGTGAGNGNSDNDGGGSGSGQDGETRSGEGESSPYARWDDRAGGLFRLRILEPTGVGTVDTVPEQNL